MYRLKESGRGKLFCYTGGLVPLNDLLSQTQLKELFNANCEFVIYEQSTKQETSTQFEPVREANTTDTSNGSIGRKRNTGKANQKRTTN
jgi:hypothetical protein